MKLLKEIDQSVRPIDEVDKLIKEMMNPSDDLRRIVSYWDDYDGPEMSDDQLRDAVANDFEMLEYSPRQVEQLTAAALRQLEPHR